LALDAPSLFVKKAESISLSGSSYARLLSAVVERGVPFRFRAKGFSMSPFIKDGDVITVVSLDGEPPGLGQIAAFSHPCTGKLVVHRVVSKSRGLYLIKGDNAPEIEAVPGENILGVVSKVERNGAGRSMGLGPERLGIALLSRSGLLGPLVFLTARAKRFFLRGEGKEDE